MNCYIISYDLKKERDYNALYEAIKSYGTWAHILESTWAVLTDASATEIRENLSKFLDEDDSLFIVKSGGEAAWRNIICENDWLKKHL